MTITRQQYMTASAENGPTAHRAYYGQFVSDATIRTVVGAIGADKILASTDPHMNDIPLILWDRLRGLIPLAIRFADVGQSGSGLSDWVCIAKEAAKQYGERNRKEVL